MRGKVRVGEAYSRAYRITPAYAGKRVLSNEKENHIQDHPRLCGEKGDSVLEDTDKEGSPPPMRGKVQATAAGLKRYGITPAYAGKRQLVLA